MLEAAKFGDPVIGVDIHMVLVPAPPAPTPIPTPLPHPFVGVVFDPIGAALGAAIGLAFGGGGPVLINYMPCGNTGTDVKGVPHFPTPPGVSFAPNDIPSNDGTLIFGSKTVSMAGSSIARLTDLVMTCNFPINLPTSVCMAVPMGAPVLVGGPPSLDILAAVTKAIRTKWFSDALHKVLKVAPGSRLSKVICFLTGHPVDVMTGEVLTERRDFELPGPIPLRFERNYYSRSVYDGPLGKGWTHSLDLSVHEEDWRLVVRLADGRERYHARLPEGASVWDEVDRYTLERTAWGYTLTTAAGLTYTFARVEGAAATHPLVRVSDRCENTVRLRYARGRLDELTDSAGRALGFEHDTRGRLTRVSVRRPGERGEWWMDLVRYEYDGAGMLSAAYDAMGHPYRYEYRGGVLVKETNRNGLSFYFEYDVERPEGWCTRTWGDGGIYDRRITYDKHRHVTLVDDSRGGRTHYFGTAAGVVTKKIDPTGGVWTYAWDAQFHKIAEEDPLGNRTEWSYDERGNQTLERDPLGRETRWRYDAHGLPIEKVDAGKGVWTRTYDARGKLTRATDPLGHACAFWYDGRGNPAAAQDAAGQQTSLRFNDAGDLVEVRDLDGRTTRFDVDDLGRTVRVTGPRGEATIVTRDAVGRVVGIVRPDGARQEVTRDAEGNVVRVADARGAATQYRYAGVNRLVERVDPIGGAVRYEYDAEENLVAVVNERGERHALEYDLAGRVVRERGFGGWRVEYRYDRAGRCVEAVDGFGRRCAMEHDALGQVVRHKRFDGRESRYAYDALGLLIEASNADCELRFERDALGRVTRERAGEFVVESRYDPVGRRVWRSTSLGHQAAYDFAPGGRLRAVAIDPDPHWNRWIPEALPASPRRPWELSITRDESGQEVERRMPGGVVSRWERDLVGRPTGHRAVRHGDELWAVNYQWDPGGVMSARIDAERGPTRFDHDERGFLRAARHADGAMQHRAPDAVGDVFRTPDRSDRVYGAGGVLREIEGARHTHDVEGQLVERTLPDGSRWRYAWDGARQLRDVGHPDGATTTYAYDALGRRVRKTVNGREVAYFWDGDELVHEVAEGASPVTWVMEPGGQTPLARVEDDRRYGVLADVAGAPTALFDEAGALAWRAQLDLYGVARADVATVSCPWRWPGQYEDAETGLYYNRFRYYDPGAGRYISRDPIGLPGGLAAYAYTHDPLTWVDPFGLTGCDTVTYYRVQGGTPPNASRHLIQVDAAGGVKISNGTLNISTGTAEHAQYFLSKRPGAQIYQFEVPKWLDDFIQETAIPQAGYRSNPLNQGGLAPKIVDPTTPGRSYELPPVWSRWLEENAVPGSGRIL